MHRRNHELAAALLRLILPLALGMAFLAAVYIRFYSGLLPIRDLPVWPAYIGYFVLSITLWTGLETRFRIVYRCFEERSLTAWLWPLVQLDLLTLALVSSAAFFWRGYSFSRYTVALFWTLHVVLCFAAGWAARVWTRRRHALTCLFLIGEELSSETVRAECVLPEEEARLSRFPNAETAIRALAEFQPPPECREVLAAVSSSEAHRLAVLAQTLDRLPVPASIALEGLWFGEAHATPSFVVLSTHPSAGAFDYVFSKRIMDVLLPLAGLVLLAPLMAAIALVTWLRSGRPILLEQERVGRNGRRFRLYKFRSLPVADRADSDRRWKPPATEGWEHVLRVTGLDELPQLFNVLKGEMSLVGPRPERPHFVEQFRRQLPFYSTRHRLQAGITGWAQVHGWRGDTSIPRRVQHDLYYLRHWSLALDFRILWMTLADFLHRLRQLVTGAKGAADARSV